MSKLHITYFCFVNISSIPPMYFVGKKGENFILLTCFPACSIIERVIGLSTVVSSDGAVKASFVEHAFCQSGTTVLH